MKLTATVAALVACASAQYLFSYSNRTQSMLRTDNGTYGPPVEEVHYYYDQWPIGIAVASDGRLFAGYTRGDAQYTLGVIVNKTAEAPFPAAGPVTNLRPDQLNTSFNGIPFGVSNPNLINVQAMYVTGATANRPETLWVLDTGRPTIHSGTGEPNAVYSQPGGPKVLAINITSIDGNGANGRHNDTVYRSYTFPASVHYPDSFMNDIRFDLRTNLSDTTGQGVAYIVDSSDEGRNGFIVLDLGTGDSWRRLTQDPSVLRVNYNVPSYLSVPTYYKAKGMPINTLREGLDGVQISADLETIYYSPLTSTVLYSVPAANLRVRPQDPLAELMAHSNVSDYGQRGADANGFEGSTDGRVYQCMPTENALYYFDPADLQTHPFVRDPRIIWPDGASVGADGYIYMNINQLFFMPDWNNGTDYRQKPGAMLRVKLPGNATKIPLGDR